VINIFINGSEKFQSKFVNSRKNLNFSVVRISYPDKLRLSDNGS
jgi:hypothetical protein